MQSADNNIGIEAIEDIIVSHLNGMSDFRTIYETNRRALLSYRFLCDKNLLVAFDDLPIIPVHIGNRKYTYYEKNSKRFCEVLKIYRTKYVKKHFFQNLEKPLLVENELNTYHWEYLYDNVRKSEDYGGDNHIYLSYDNINLFLLLICVENITEYLPKEKIIFLFGKEKITDYPMDLNNKFGLDYTNIEVVPIRVEEVKRLFVNLARLACSGNTFFMGILDSHNDVLSIKGFELADFVFIYRSALCDRTVSEVEKNFEDKTMDALSLKSLMLLFDGRSQGKCLCPTHESFFTCLKNLFNNDYKPKEIEWFKGMFLAYAMSLGRAFRGRISPAIKFETHFSVSFPMENKRWEYNNAIFSQFKYCMAMLPMRYHVIAQSSMVDKWIGVKSKRNPVEWLPKALLGDYRLCTIYKKDKLSYTIKVLRFEDFKQYPKASLLSLCEYLDIPWDDMLMKVTANGTEYMAFGTGAFDTAPLKKRYYNVCNPFDYYRIELVMSKYWKHFGYEPMFYKGDNIYTKEEIKKMFELPFQCEQYITDEKEKARIPELRKQMYALVEKRLNEGDAPLDEHGKEMLPIPWLKPKMEFVDGELYS